MDLLNVFSVLSRWVHIVSVVVAVGGAVFMRIALIPAADETLTPELHDTLRSQVFARWKKVVHICVLLLILSGSYNFFMSIHDGVAPIPYHILFLPKLVMAFVVFFLAIALTGSSPGFASLRARRKKWLSVLIILAAVIIALSGVMKAVHQSVIAGTGTGGYHYPLH